MPKSSKASSRLQLPNGFILADKPRGWSSHDVVHSIRDTLESHFKLSGSKPQNPKKWRNNKAGLKVGHGGTLDPLATGALVLGVGSGTKQMAAILAGPKSYTAVAQLGFETDTQDTTGAPLGPQLSYEVLKDSDKAL